jgi:hypothetical protein
MSAEYTSKTEIKKAMSAVYFRLAHSNDNHFTVAISGGHVIEGAKAYKRTGRVAWKVNYRATRFDGQTMQWEEGMIDAFPCIMSFLGVRS